MVEFIFEMFSPLYDMELSNTALFPSLAFDAAFAPESKIWVYMTDRPLNPAESQYAQEALAGFTRQWTAHNQALKARAEVFENRYIVLMVDETGAGASGCSIDKSVHFLENLGRRLGADFFERMQFSWVEGDRILFTDRAGLSQETAAGRIKNDTLMVNTLVQSKKDLLEKWLLPFDNSWHKRLI